MLHSSYCICGEQSFGTAIIMTKTKMNKQHIINEIKNLLNGKQSLLNGCGDRNVQNKITLSAREIHEKLNLHASYPPVCEAMKTVFRAPDKIIRLPDEQLPRERKPRKVCNGKTFDEQSDEQNYKGSNLTIEYDTTNIH